MWWVSGGALGVVLAAWLLEVSVAGSAINAGSLALHIFGGAVHVVRVCAFLSSWLVHLYVLGCIFIYIYIYIYRQRRRERERERDVYQAILQCNNCIGGWGKSLAWKSIPSMVRANARA